jgi:drug/metabolite transporter (DMT)-like permease
MGSLRHIFWFLALGLFWGLSPSLYRHLANIRMPETHTIVYTGFGVGVIMFAIALFRDGWHRLDPRIPFYGTVCAFLMNIPFGLNLFLASHVPPTELSIIITMSPFFNYLLALVTRTESASIYRLLAIGLGFLSTTILILSRDRSVDGTISWWLIAAIGVPLLYTAYNAYAAHFWPKGANIMQAGAAESIASGLLMLPLMLYLSPPGAADTPAWPLYWILGAVTLMWVIERIAYFTLINEKGAVYTVQATYVSTPAAVIIAAVFYGGTTDKWLWLSLAVLMVALWFNNTGRSSATIAPANPESHPG